MSEPKPTYTTFTTDPLRPPVRDDWGWESDEAEDTNTLDKVNYREDTRADEILAYRMRLDDIRAEFEAVYRETPPVFQVRWERVARLLGVIK